MTTEIQMTCNVAKDDSFDFLVTSHEGNSGAITIHGNGLTASIYCSPKQANNLIEELHAALIKLEVYEKVHEEKVKCLLNGGNND